MGLFCTLGLFSGGKNRGNGCRRLTRAEILHPLDSVL
jgi:hypothetical protein